MKKFLLKNFIPIILVIFLVSVFIISYEKNKLDIISNLYDTSLISPETYANKIDDDENPYDTTRLPANTTDYNLTLDDKLVKDKLEENQFVVLPNKEYAKIYELYKDCENNNTPVFITTDSILHTAHLILSWNLRFLEIAHLRGDLLNLTDGLIAKSYSYYELIGENNLKQAALKNVIYFTIAKQLLSGGGALDNVPGDIQKIIDTETKRIDLHKEVAESSLMGYKEDYTQYIPRGHYDRSPEFKTYFKAMMWYSRIYFPINNDLNTLQAMLICRALNETEIKGESAKVTWNRVYKTTAFFCGEADDLTFDDYDKAITKVYGKNPEIEEFANKSKLQIIKDDLSKMQNPQILSSISGSNENLKQFQGFRFIGQRFAFDSYIFQNLIFNKVSEYKGVKPTPFTESNGIRCFAKGLDVMSVLGSKEAEEILIQDNDVNFKGYNEQVEMLKQKLDFFYKNRISNIYDGRLYVLKTLFNKPQSKFLPAFMETKAWQLKELNTALGSWAELKHDSVLYSKEPYTYAQRAMSTLTKGGVPEPTPEPIRGYVEPNIELYKTLGSIFNELNEKFKILGLPDDAAFTQNIDRFESLLKSLEKISENELEGVPLTAKDYELMEHYGSKIKQCISFNHYYDVMDDFQTKDDEEMPIIADVLTDINTQMVLEEAVGPPFVIYAIIEIENKKTICKGGVYSYYEFKWPMNDRLTDNNWRKILKDNKEPKLPLWVSNFMAIKDLLYEKP